MKELFINLNKCHKEVKILSFIFMAITSNTGAASELINAQSIINKSNLASYYAADDGRGEVRMLIVDKQGRKQRRQFSMLRKNTNVDETLGGDQKFLVLFNQPSDIRRTTFRVEKHVSSDDDRWLYLPALDLVKRIASGDKRTSFMGSHLFYEDVTGRSTMEDSHSLVETTSSHYVIHSIPKVPSDVEFTDYKVWIDKTNFLPARFEYKNHSGEVYRRIETIESKNFEGYPTITKSKITDTLSGGYTLVNYRSIDYNLGVPLDVFSEQSLRSPPRKWLIK